MKDATLARDTGSALQCGTGCDAGHSRPVAAPSCKPRPCWRTGGVLMRCCGVAAKPTIQVRCDGARWPAAFRCPVSKPGTQSAVLDQIVAVYLRWSHVAWTPSWFAVETSDEGLPQH